jgi:hypothetical protein
MPPRVLGLLAAAWLAATPALAADYRAPRNGLGQPDLQGVWNTNFVLPLEAPATDAPPLVLSETEARAYVAKLSEAVRSLAAFKLDPEVADLSRVNEAAGLAIVKGQRRTRQIVQPADGRLPATRAARSQIEFVERVLRTREDAPFPTDGPETRPNWERCLVGQGQPPVTIVTSINPREILQTRDAVVVLSEYGPDLRIIPFAATHANDPARASPLGDSIARWEGDTLVIETIGLPAKDTIRPLPTLLVSATAKVIERYTRVGPSELLYQYTVVDPSTYTAPWLAEYSLTRSNKPLYEFACHEGNYSLPNILAGARQLEKAAAGR